MGNEQLIAGWQRKTIDKRHGYHSLHKVDRKLQPLVRDICWSENLLVLSRCKDNLKRELHNSHSSHGLRGNSSGNALRSVTQERHWLHSHAERGNDI